jgi:uncharacterized membrane protein YfcA
VLAELLAGALIGLVLGLTGAGGSVLAVPLFVHLLHMPVPVAIGTSLGAVALAAGTGAAMRFRVRQLPLRPTVVFALTGMPMAAIGLEAGERLPPAQLLAGFGVLMLLIATRQAWLLRTSPEYASTVRAAADLEGELPARCPLGDDGRFRIGWRCAGVLAIAGALTGFLAGLLGVGGGFLIVPALTLFAGLGMHLAVGSSLLIIALVAGSGFAHHLLGGGAADLPRTAQVMAGAVAGMVLGLAVAGHVRGATLQYVFTALIAATGLFVLVSGLPAP